ncbi:MAG: hypothetical protein MRY72_01125 [Aquisalinus sp.]|nr:hypothetical protein [Aquisalinus sp.]
MKNRPLYLWSVFCLVLSSIYPTQAVASWDPFGLEKIRRESQEWREQVELEMEELRKVANAAIRAVPGERYLQIIDALHGPDPEKAEEARNFLRSLGNLDPETTYVASVWFGLESELEIRADIFRASSPSRIHVEQKIASRGLNLTQSIKNSLERPKSETEIRANIRRELKSALLSLSNQYSKINYPRNFADSQTALTIELSQSSPFLPPSINSGIIAINGEGTQLFRGRYDRNNISRNFDIQKRRQADDIKFNNAVQHLENAILTISQNDFANLGRTELSIPWSAFDSKQFLFVVIPEKDWIEHKDKLRIKALVHKVNEPKNGINLQRPYEFEVGDFDPELNEPIDHWIPGAGKLVWAVHEMTGDSRLFTPETLALIEEADSILAEWSKREQ